MGWSLAGEAPLGSALELAFRAWERGSTMLEWRAVSRSFRGGGGVHEVSLTVGVGEIVALVGMNGAGKTTLMRLGLGMLRPDSGGVRINGHDLRSAPREVWCGVGHLIEAPLAYPELTTRQNLILAARLRLADPRCAEAAIDEWRLRPFADRRARRLSLGNRQRVGLQPLCSTVHRWWWSTSRATPWIRPAFSSSAAHCSAGRPRVRPSWSAATTWTRSLGSPTGSWS